MESLSRTDEEFATIYQHHVKTVYRVCYLYLKNTNDTEDMVQNTFLKLIRCPKHFESEEHEKAWLIVTASNLCRDFLRHWWRKTSSLEQAIEQSAPAAPEPDETLEKVLSLPDKYKAPIYLYYYEDYTCEQIARFLRRNESTVRSQLRKGRQLLKLKIGGETI